MSAWQLHRTRVIIFSVVFISIQTFITLSIKVNLRQKKKKKKTEIEIQSRKKGNENGLTGSTRVYCGPLGGRTFRKPP